MAATPPEAPRPSNRLPLRASRRASLVPTSAIQPTRSAGSKLSSMTRAWAAEFSPSGVRVHAIAPGPVDTGGAAPERIEALGAATLLHRAADPAEIAEVVAFLASPRASYVAGATVAADGGRTAI